jgi:hypothetical protein
VPVKAVALPLKDRANPLRNIACMALVRGRS